MAEITQRLTAAIAGRYRIVAITVQKAPAESSPSSPPRFPGFPLSFESPPHL
jgi:hypothetical protein